MTGGARERGQGAAHAEWLAREGATVVIGDIRDEEGSATAERLRAAGGDVHYVRLDVRKSEDWSRVIGDIETSHGKLNVLVNNAGVMSWQDAENATDQEWHDVIAVNQTGVFFGIRAAVPAMKRAGGGSIINIASAVVSLGTPGIFGYQATKAAVVAMTKSAAAAYGKFGIRVNAVGPGLVFTPMQDDIRDVWPDWDPVAQELPSQAIAVRATGHNIAPMVVYFASDESIFHTGDFVTIDGGQNVGGNLVDAPGESPILSPPGS
ncbi:SDR family NAD(P)-dependent oxidoreductase [Mycolicibacterium sp. CBM1]